MKWSELSSRERDALVAKHVLGCQTHPYNGEIICNCYDAPHRESGLRMHAAPLLAEYTSDWSAMEVVVKAMAAKAGEITMRAWPDNDYEVTIGFDGHDHWFLRAWPLPDLVAFVSLRALGVEIEE